MKKVIIDLLKRVSLFILKRNYIKKIGKCEIYEDRIICFVDDKKIKKTSNEFTCYNLWLYGNLEYNKKFLQECGINKPVLYYFENIQFDKQLYINAYNDSELIFKNCTFIDCININHANNIIFDNNRYLSSYNYRGGNTFNISCRKIEDANSIKFLNEKFIVESKFKDLNISNKKESSFTLNLSSSEVSFDDCNIKNINLFSCRTRKLLLKDTTISSNEFCVTADNIKSSKSKIVSKNGVIIETNNCDRMFLNDIESEYIVFNDEEIENVSEIKKEINSLRNQRLLLLNVFKKLQYNCNNVISEELIELSNTMNKESIKKVLKK